MSELLHQPEVELTSSQTSLETRLIEELRMYPTEAEFHLGMKGLYALHANTKFAHMIESFASTAGGLYAELSSQPEQGKVLEDMFMAGGILGLYASTSDLPPHMIIGIHESVDPEVDETTGNITTDAAKADLMHLLGHVADSHTDQLESYSAHLVDAAAELYSYTGEETERYFFALGFRFVVDTVVDFSAAYKDIENVRRFVNVPVV